MRERVAARKLNDVSAEGVLPYARVAAYLTRALGVSKVEIYVK